MGPGIFSTVARAIGETLSGPDAAALPNFSGRWLTSFGPMQLSQNGNQVQGDYDFRGTPCQIAGTIENGKLVFEYCEPTVSGEGWFELLTPGKFAGQWRPHGVELYARWEGRREFEGIWETSFGPMRLIQTADRIFGCYEGVGFATVEGKLEEGRFTFRYHEPKIEGEGWFTLAEDGQSFEGQWHEDGKAQWSPWFGRRVQPVPGLTWLVVIEAHWQRSLTEREYAFGNMLREFFARLPQVQVRQRFFDSEVGLEKWCRELMYLAEPTVVVIAAHGNEEGLQALGKAVNPRAMVEALRYADNIEALHFSSCLMMQDGRASDLARTLQRDCRFPISGYNTSVDWAASALIEFHYLDMILGRGLSPADAADQITKLLTYAGDHAAPDSPYPGAGFRFFGRKTSE